MRLVMAAKPHSVTVYVQQCGWRHAVQNDRGQADHQQRRRGWSARDTGLPVFPVPGDSSAYTAASSTDRVT